MTWWASFPIAGESTQCHIKLYFLKFGSSFFDKTTDNFYSCRVPDANSTFLGFQHHFHVYGRILRSHCLLIQSSLGHSEFFCPWISLRTAQVVSNVQRYRACMKPSQWSCLLSCLLQSEYIPDKHHPCPQGARASSCYQAHTCHGHLVHGRSLVGKKNTGRWGPEKWEPAWLI